MHSVSSVLCSPFLIFLSPIRLRICHLFCWFTYTSLSFCCYYYYCYKVYKCLVTQSCPALCDPMDCSPPGSSVHGDSPGKNTGMSCHVLLQGIFPIQRSNTGLLHCRQILYHWATNLLKQSNLIFFHILA